MPPAPQVRHRLLGFALACHPGPTAAVTLAVAGLSLAAGRSLGGALATGVAVLAGQLSVGWCNDARDAGRDGRAHRTDKPTVRGWVTARQLGIGAALAAAACVPLSYAALGAVAGTLHLIAVASAWSYDLLLKTTVFSALPYALSFGLVPAVVTYSLTPPGPPQWWATLAAALLGVGAHLANSAPDIDSDREVAAGGLSAAIGKRASQIGAVVALLAANALLVAQLSAPLPVRLAVIAVLAALAIGGCIYDRGRRLFEIVLVIGLADVVLVALSASAFVAAS